MEENTRNFNKEYEKLTNDKIFKTTQELKELGIQSSNKKNGRKLDEIKIHKDFLKQG